jgi:hypothetical protein
MTDAAVITEPEPEGTTGLEISESENATGHNVVVLTNTHSIKGGRDVFVRRDELDEVLGELLRIRAGWGDAGVGYTEQKLSEYRELEAGDERPAVEARDAALLSHFASWVDEEATK